MVKSVYNLDELDRRDCMVRKELLDILRCPVCVKDKKGNLTLFKDAWLICENCGRKYPIVEDIPVMLIEEGDKWIETTAEALQIPPVI